MNINDAELRRQVVWRARLVVICLALAVLAFWQQPGWIAADTKLDLTADPLGFLGRALYLWDESSSFGQLQNQAYGYLFPMGPFFVVGDWSGAPAWVVQRAWWSLILIVAFLGVVRLSGAMGIGKPWSRVLAGLAYALAPRILASLGAVSIEAWPTAVAPWVLLPLVRASQGGSLRRNAAISALAVCCIGGVNAAATAAAVVPAVLWLILTPGWTSRWRFSAWWLGAMAVATVWWWVPVLLLGGYSPPFLDWIETASVTSQFTSPVEVFRGSDHWLSYLGSSSGPEWPAGWLLTHEPVLIFDTMLLAAIGLGGLARRDMPGRRVLLAGVVIGLLVVTSAYVGPGSGPLAEQVRQFLDGPLAPLRNVHKFDVVLRLPLALGLAHALAMVRLKGLSQRYVRVLATAITAVALIGTATPALAGQIPRQSSYLGIPAYWEETANWLDQHVGTGRALLVPGASFGEYAWGGPRDEPLQALTDDTRWAVRDAVPLSSAGNIRLLDAIETRLASGEGGAGIVEALDRAGVSHLVVRNDLDREATGAPRPIVLHQAVADIPGLERVAAFGPDVGELDDPEVTHDSRLNVMYPAVEVFAFAGASMKEHRVRTYPLEGSVRMSGGPESLLTAAEAGVIEDRVVFVAGDGASVEDPSPVPVIADGLRRRAVSFGAMRNNTSEVLRSSEEGPLDRPVRDYLPVDDVSRETVAVVGGVSDVTASSAGSEPTATMARGAEHSPWSALDGDPGTAWISGVYGEAVGQWLEVRFDQPRALDGLEVAVVEGGPISTPVTTLAVTTDAGTVENAVRPGEELQALAPPEGETTFVRVTITDVGPGPPSGVGIAELQIPGVTVSRSLSAPTVQAGDLGGPAKPETMVFSTSDGRRGDCVMVEASTRCASQLARAGEEDAALDRQFELAVGGDYSIVATVRPRPGEALENLLEISPDAISAAATSRATDDIRGRPGAAVDRDRGTGWIADPDDDAPALTFTWTEERQVRGLELIVDPSLAASRPNLVAVTLAGERYELDVDADGEVVFAVPMTVDELTVEILDVHGVVDVDPDFGWASMLPAGLSEVRILGADDLRLPVDGNAETGLACGFAPPLVVDGKLIATEARGRIGDLLSDGSLDVRPCVSSDSVTLDPGVHTVELDASALTRPETVTLRPEVDPVPPGNGADVSVQSWGPTSRVIDVGTREISTVLAVSENANAGWRATLDGHSLDSVRLDGWSQGFVLPPGEAGTVELVYGPDASYRAALIGGGLGVFAVLGMALWRRRPLVGAVDPDHQASTVRIRGGWRPGAAAFVVNVVALALMGGVAGLTAAGIAAVVALVACRWTMVIAAVPALAVAAALAGGIIVAARPWPDVDPGAQAASAQHVILLAVALAVIGTQRLYVRRRGRFAASRSSSGVPTASTGAPLGGRTATTPAP